MNASSNNFPYPSTQDLPQAFQRTTSLAQNSPTLNSHAITYSVCTADTWQCLCELVFSPQADNASSNEAYIYLRPFFLLFPADMNSSEPFAGNVVKGMKVSTHQAKLFSRCGLNQI